MQQTVWAMDGSFFAQRISGIQRYSIELLAALFLKSGIPDIGFTSSIIHYGWYAVQLENCVPGWIFPPGRYIIPKDKDLVCCPGNIFNFFGSLPEGGLYAEISA